MAKRFISKGDLTSDGTRKLIATIVDADGRVRDEVVGEVPDEEADARIQALVGDGQYVTWPQR